MTPPSGLTITIDLGTGHELARLWLEKISSSKLSILNITIPFRTC